MDLKNKKCLKKTTYVQFQKLVDLMEEFPHLANGTISFGSKRAAVEQTWDAVAERVNPLGPPTRSGWEWKKVWHDQKCRLKKKITENNKSLNGMGGGPFAFNNLTEMELHIDRICHLSSAGAPGGTHVKVAVVTPTISKRTNEQKKYQQFPDISNIITPEHSPLKTTQTHSQESLISSQQTTLSSTLTQERKEVEVRRPLFHQQRKRKNIESNYDKHTFLRQRIKIQNKTLDVMKKQLEAAKIQAEAVKIQAESSKEQAIALKEIADSSKVMAQCLVDIVKHFKDKDKYFRADYISHYHHHYFSCVDWKQAPEATVGNCTRYGRYGAVRCYGGINNLLTSNDHKVRKMEEIIFCGWPEKVFNPVLDLQPFPKIKSLTIEYSDMTEIIYDFPEMIYLQTINISWTNLSQIAPRTFKRIYNLRIVDLRWNQLIQLDSPLALPRSFQELYLAGNPWNCTRNFKWLLIPEEANVVADRDVISCSDRKYKDRLLLTVMNYKWTLKNDCQSHADTQNCTCTMHHIIPKSHIPLYTVNCSNLGFERLPSYLPENTTMFFANNNKITDVSPLRNNIHYRYVVDVHLENNSVENIDVLEGGYWLEHFRLLNLKNNKLKKIPVYALDNALDDNPNANLLLLSRNPWHCSCKFAMRFREILNKYNAILRDAWNISCTYIQGDEIKTSKVLAISREDVCKPKDESKIHALDWVNGLLASMIVFILGKLAYDYYYYKNYGRVPWIVMKLP